VNFLLDVGRTGGKVQHPVVDTKIEVLISARPYNCTDLEQFFRHQICGTDCVCE